MSSSTMSHGASASDLLASQVKKLTFEVPTDKHTKLKSIAAAHNTSIRALIEEALDAYTFPKYLKEVR
ncbi:hypothetical protein D9M68_600890 [compost metagenome]